MREVITAKEAIDIIEHHYGSIEVVKVSENADIFCISENDHGEDYDVNYYVDKASNKIITMSMWDYLDIKDMKIVPEEEWKQ